jgi:hypothetical protein
LTGFALNDRPISFIAYRMRRCTGFWPSADVGQRAALDDAQRVFEIGAFGVVPRVSESPGAGATVKRSGVLSSI